MRGVLWGGIVMMLLGGLSMGCQPWGQAQMIKRDRQGGILALQGDRDKAWEDARYQMYDHCRGERYEVVSEEMVTVGERTVYREDSNQRSRSSRSRRRSDDRRAGTSSRTRSSRSTGGVARTEPLREYQITYSCTTRAPVQ